jgi:hypothetical protein
VDLREEAQVLPDAIATRAPAAAARAAPEREAEEPHRKGALERLDRRVARVRHVRLHAARAGAARAGARSAGDRLVVGEARTRERQVAHRAGARGRDARGQQHREGAEDDVDDALAGLDVARRDAGGIGGVDERAGSREDPHRTQHAVVGRCSWREQRAQAVEDRRVRDRARGVERAPRRGVARAEVAAQRRGAALQHDADPRARARGILEHVLERRPPRRETAHERARQPLGPVHQLAGAAPQLVLAVLGREREQALLPDAVGGPLRQQVALALGRTAHVGEDEGQGLALERAGAHQVQRRDAQALAVDVLGARHRAGDGAAHVGVVRAVGAEEIRPRAPGQEHGRDDGQVGQVRAAAVGIVEQHGVARSHRHALDRGLDAHRRRAQVDRQVRGLADHAPAAVEERAGEVAPLADVGRERGAQERRAHLLGRGREQVLEHVEAQRIEGARTCSGGICRGRAARSRALPHR